MPAAMSTESVQEATRAAKDAARTMVGEQQQAAASGLGDFATVLRKAARDMDGTGKSSVCRLAESAADGLEHFSGTLRNKDLNAIVHDVESFARRQPVAFLGAAVAVGFLASRFLKASAPAKTGAAPLDPNIPF